MRNAFCFTVVVLLGLLFIPGQAAAVTILNPGFESGDLTGWDSTLAPDPNTSLSVRSDVPVNTGTFAAEFGATACCDAISQSLVTTPATYAITYFLQSDAGTDTNAGFELWWNNALVGSAPGGAFGYQPFTFNVSNAGSTGLLMFRGWNSAAYYHLDDVSIATVGPGPVPEPATFALIGIGLTTLALVRRKYRR